MPFENGMIITPVTEPSDIQQALDLSGITNYGTLIRPDLFGFKDFNKMSKHKPLDRNVMHTLTEEQFRSGVNGESGTNGIFWGLRMSTSAYDWSSIHEADWEYVEKPTGGIGSSPYRPYDVVGYDKNAEPTISGTSDLQLSDAEIIYTAEIPFSVALSLNLDGNETGVDPFDALGIDTSDAWLCVAIDDYAAAMINGRAGDIVAPLSQGAQEFDCPPLPDDLQAEATSRQVTLFIANLNNATALKTKGKWVYINGVSMGTKAASIPDLIALPVKFSEEPSLGYGTWTLSVVSASGTTFNVSTINTVKPTYLRGTTIYYYEIIGEFNNVAGTKKEFTIVMTSADTTVFNQVLSYDPTSDFGVSNPVNGTEFNYTITLKGVKVTYDSSSEILREQQLATLTGTFTYTGTDNN